MLPFTISIEPEGDGLIKGLGVILQIAKGMMSHSGTGCGMEYEQQPLYVKVLEKIIDSAKEDYATAEESNASSETYLILA